MVAGLRGVEAATRRGVAVSHRLLAQCEQQRTATTLGHRSLEVLLRRMLRISAADVICGRSAPHQGAARYRYHAAAA